MFTIWRTENASYISRYKANNLNCRRVMQTGKASESKGDMSMNLRTMRVRAGWLRTAGVLLLMAALGGARGRRWRC